jgi:hypothetical protein
MMMMLLSMKQVKNAEAKKQVGLFVEEQSERERCSSESRLRVVSAKIFKSKLVPLPDRTDNFD